MEAREAVRNAEGRLGHGEESGFYPKAVASNFDVEKLTQPVRKGQGARAWVMAC